MVALIPADRILYVDFISFATRDSINTPHGIYLAFDNVPVLFLNHEVTSIAATFPKPQPVFNTITIGSLVTLDATKNMLVGFTGDCF